MRDPHDEQPPLDAAIELLCDAGAEDILVCLFEKATGRGSLFQYLLLNLQ